MNDEDGDLDDEDPTYSPPVNDCSEEDEEEYEDEQEADTDDLKDSYKRKLFDMDSDFSKKQKLEEGSYISDEDTADEDIEDMAVQNSKRENNESYEEETKTSDANRDNDNKWTNIAEEAEIISDNDYNRNSRKEVMSGESDDDDMDENGMTTTITNVIMIKNSAATGDKGKNEEEEEEEEGYISHDQSSEGFVA